MSGPVLGTFVSLAPSPKFIPRFYLANLVVAWAEQFVVQCGQNLILQETLFGGYRAHISLHAWLWPFSGKTAQLADMFETFYVTAPGSTTPITPGIVGIAWTMHGSDHLPDLFVTLAGNNGMITTDPLPPATPAYWQIAWQTTWPNCHTEHHP